MILYTERQLVAAYSALAARLTIADQVELIPSLEEFRPIFEAEWELYYKDEEIH